LTDVASRSEDSAVRGTLTTVFVSDPTAEAERIAQALRGAGYLVVDVPLSMLIARVAVQHPRVILVDADGDGALDVVARMRELPNAEAIDVLFVARPGGSIASPEEALAHEGSGLFIRPVDVPALVRKVEALTGGTKDERGDAPPPPPPSVPASSRKRSSVPPSLPPASMRTPEAIAAAASRRPPPVSSPPRLPSEPPPSVGGGGGGRRLVGLSAPVSPELQQLLADAEQRAQVGSETESIIPSPEDEIEAVLPAEFLASLDEPLEEDEDDDEIALPARSAISSATREPTHDGGVPRTGATPTTGVGSTAGSSPGGTGAGAAGERPLTGEAGLTPPPQTHGGTSTGQTGAGPSTSGGSAARAEDAATPPPVLARERHESVPPPTAWSPEIGTVAPVANVAAADFPAVLTPGDAMRVLARAVVQRTTGSLCFAAPDAERRVVLREGDVVTTSSTGEDESLLAFLGVRGDLPKETVRRLETKFPPFGRHAGAALVARGYLRQDQMWPTLRAHAEWLLVRALQTAQGRLLVEPEPPGRLAGEPSVFGGSTGAEVFVELVRRTVPPAEALERVGGLSSRLADGPEARLFSECALGPTEVEQLRGMAGRSVHDVLEGAPESDLATVIYALAQLGVVEVLRGVGEDVDGHGQASEAQVAAIDAEGVRARVRARLQLVEDGDYFSLLGVSHEATGYEVRRAFLELRRAFDPSRVLTPEVADLAEDVKQITMVLEEAYDILKDSARRERYRRAIEAVPEG
jgi:hypothetical protein